MKLVTLKQDNWEKYRRPLLRFTKRHDSTRTKHVFSWIFSLNTQQLEAPGNSVIMAMWDGKIIGLIVVSNFGANLSEVVLAPTYKHTDIKSLLMKEAMYELGVLYKNISYSDETSIKEALQAGLVCFSYIEESGKPTTLWFGGGHWHAQDVNEKEA